MEHPAIDRAFNALFPGDFRELGVGEKLEQILGNSHVRAETALILEALCEGAQFQAGTGVDETKLCKTRDHIDSLLGTSVEWDEITMIHSLLREGKSTLEIMEALKLAA
jgi:hypothetical protein